MLTKKKTNKRTAQIRSNRDECWVRVEDRMLNKSICEGNITKFFLSKITSFNLRKLRKLFFLSFFFAIILLLWFLLIFPSFLYQFFPSFLFTSNSLFVFSLFCFAVFPCYSHFLDVFSLILFFHSHFYHFSPSLLSSFTFPCYLSPLSISSL